MKESVMKLRTAMLIAALVATVSGTAEAGPLGGRGGYAAAPYYSYNNGPWYGARAPYSYDNGSWYGALAPYSYNNGPWYDYAVPYSGDRSYQHRR